MVKMEPQRLVHVVRETRRLRSRLFDLSDYYGCYHPPTLLPYLLRTFHEGVGYVRVSSRSVHRRVKTKWVKKGIVFIIESGPFNDCPT